MQIKILLLLTMLFSARCDVASFVGPITPNKLDAGQICEEFFVGEQLIGSTCVVNPLDLLSAERAFLNEHRETTGIRRMR